MSNGGNSGKRLLERAVSQRKFERERERREEVLR